VLRGELRHSYIEFQDGKHVRDICMEVRGHINDGCGEWLES